MHLEGSNLNALPYVPWCKATEQLTNTDIEGEPFA